MADTHLSSSFDYDLAVLGAGSAGFAGAGSAAGAGLKVALIDGAQELGGLCILRGCMPTKTLLHAAEVLHHARHSMDFGVQPGTVTFDFGKVMERKRRLIHDFAEYRRGQLRHGKFDLIEAFARFTGPHTLMLSNGRTLTARWFLLATGSNVAPCPVPGVDQLDYITSDDALELDHLPKSMIILGGGAVAVEFAQFFVRFGVEITLIQRSPQILREFDRDLAVELEKVLKREGIHLYTGTKLLEGHHTAQGATVLFEQHERKIQVSAEKIFYGLGRTPNTSGLGLEHAGVLTEFHRILTSDQMQTSVPHIYAAGDCRGRHEIVHFAVRQAEIAVHNMLNPSEPKALDYRLLTTVIFTDPQAAFVGLTEKEAAVQSIPYLTASYPFNDEGKGIIMNAREGFVKLLAAPKSGEILGASILGPFGGELLHEIIAGMYKRMTVHELADTPHYHPTLAEIWTYPAEELAALI